MFKVGSAYMGKESPKNNAVKPFAEKQNIYICPWHNTHKFTSHQQTRYKTIVTKSVNQIFTASKTYQTGLE